MSKTTDDAYERAEAHDATVLRVQTPARRYYANRDNGDMVYLSFGDDTRGKVTGIVIRPRSIAYLVTWADTRNESLHGPEELRDAPEIN